MKLISTFIQSIQTGKGLLLFLVGLIVVWLGGYYLIDFITPDEWTRYHRQLYFSRFTLIVALLLMISASLPHLKNFISDTKKTATDLSIFRILFFGFFAIGLIFNPSAVSDQVIPFLDLPRSAQVKMPFMGWYPKVVPINEMLVSLALVLFYCTIFTALVGFKTRWSIIIFTITLSYLFAIPNLYGKVNHNHHLIWFPAILAFSPCADRFSIDAYFRRRSNKVIHHAPNTYSLPFIFIWTLIGLIYFFPGFWKMWSNGLDWVLTDNVRNHMYIKWFQLSGWESWTPFFRIDHYPILYKSSGLFTVLFELFLIPLILNKSTRKLGIFMGLLFHVGTLIFMQIFFVVLLWSYLSFVKWSKIPLLKEKSSLGSLKQSNFDFSMVKWIGIALICSCIVFGFGKWNSWPFTVYPTFDAMVPEETQQLIYVGKTISGEQIELPIQPLHDEYTSPRYAQLKYDLIQSQNEYKPDTVLLNQFVAVYSRKFDQLKTMEIFIEKQSVIPEKRATAPRSLIYSKVIQH